MKQYILIEAYIDETNTIIGKNVINDNQLEEIDFVIQEIKKCTYNYNWATNETIKESAYELYFKSNLIPKNKYDLFCDFVPQYEDGILSIKSIKILINKDITILL